MARNLGQFILKAEVIKSIFSAIFISGFALISHAEGLDGLIQAGESQARIQKALDEETRTFESIKNAVETGEIKKGLSQKFILKRYGAPVITLPDKKYQEKWVYKPGYATWFDGVKIYLFFDSEENLQGIRILNASK